MAMDWLATHTLAVVPARFGRLQWMLALVPHAIILLAGLCLVVVLWWKLGRRGALIGLAATIAIGAPVGALLWPARSRATAVEQPGTGSSSFGPWLTFMADCRRTGSAPGTGGPKSGEQLWAFRDGLSRGPFGGSPAVVGDRVYVGSDNCKLYCFDAFTGGVVWEFRAAHEVFASPVVSAGRVFVGEGLHHTKGARLYCLDAATGEELWHVQTASHIEFSPTLVDDKLYFGAGDDGIYCVDADTGRKLWQHADAQANMSPAVTERGVYFGTTRGGTSFCCLRPSDGGLLWRKPAPYGVCGSPSTDGERVYFGLGNGTFEMSHAQPKGSAWCLSATDGRKLWSRDVGDAVLTTVALSRDSAYFGSRDGHLYCVGNLTGALRWAFDTAEPVLSSPAVVDGRVYFGCNDGCVRCVGAGSGEPIWQYDTSQVTFSADARVISSPAVAHDRLYIGSMNLFFFCLGATARERPGGTTR
jgi:outer membrane protein assembly factor BamB